MRAAVIDNHAPQPLPAPEGWDEARDGKCNALFVRPQMLGGVHFMRSAWEADPGEALHLLAGGNLILGIAGHEQPVVNLVVEQCPDTFAPVLTARQFATLDGIPGLRVEMLFSTPDGQRRGFVEVDLRHTTYAEATAAGVREIEQLARSEGWIV